jgi:hypothetical protein
VPSLSQSAVLRRQAQASTSTVAMTERTPACMTTDTSAAVSLITTCCNPHSAVSSTISEKAVESRGFLSRIARFLHQ